MAYLPNGQLGRWMLEWAGIWQMELLDQDGFASFTKDRGLGFSYGSDIQQLWRIGLLKADVVEAECELLIPGLELLKRDEDRSFRYLDTRRLVTENGLSDALKAMPDLPCKVRLFYHPFRYYMLYQVERVLSPHIHPKQQLLYSAGYRQLVEDWQQRFDQLTSGASFADQLRNWESLTELAIATEPHFYEQLFSTTRRPIELDTDAQQAMVEAYLQELRRFYEDLGQDAIEEGRRSLCITAEILDPNKTVHNILRLTSGEARVKNVKGRLGGSLLLLTMAEMLRRAEEMVFGVQLPEEDEMGFGIVFRDTRRRLYGSERLFDGDRKVADAFLRQEGLDYGPQVRWYFEGQTEYYAVQSVLEDWPAIQLVNLRGRVAERGDRGVAFRDSLRNDIAAGVFSWVSIDGDRQDFVRAVQKAAVDDEICGMFFIAEPDFEFANFTLTELENVLWELALESGAEDSRRAQLHDAIVGANSAKDLLKRAQRALPELADVAKGAEWGKRLMKYAFEHLEAPLGFPTETQPRQVLDALQWAIHATSANYKVSRKEMRVNPATGRPIDR